MSIKSGGIILGTAALLIAAFYAYWQYLPGTRLHVDDVANRQVVYVPYTRHHAAIDPPASVRVAGHLDGKAVIYQHNPTAQHDSLGLPVWHHNELHGPNPTLLRLKAGKVDTTITFGTGSTAFSLVYLPLTAKHGTLTISVAY